MNFQQNPSVLNSPAKKHHLEHAFVPRPCHEAMLVEDSIFNDVRITKKEVSIE